MNSVLKNHKTPCAAALLLGLVMFIVSVPAQAESDADTWTYNKGTSSSDTLPPGVTLTLPAYTKANQTGWQLISFVWLSAPDKETGNTKNTGRDDLLVFDNTISTSLEGMTVAKLKTTTDGLIAKSTYDTNEKQYYFTDTTLYAGKNYYFLNTASITETTDRPKYGFTGNGSISIDCENSDMASIVVGQRWSAAGNTWTAKTGSVNFSVTLIPVIGKLNRGTVIMISSVSFWVVIAAIFMSRHHALQADGDKDEKSDQF